MGKSKNSFEKKELAGKGRLEKAFAYKFGKKGLEALFSGVLCISEAFKGRELETGMDKKEATEELIKLMEDAARKCDGTKLRLLADTVEARKLSNSHDPLRVFFLSMLPITYSMKAVDKQLDNIVIPELTAPKTAEEVQDSIGNSYPKGEVPSLKNIREVARELGVTLVKAKSGAEPGIPRKPLHRAKQ